MSFQPNLQSSTTHLFIKAQEVRAHYRNASKAYLKQVSSVALEVNIWRKQNNYFDLTIKKKK